MYARSIARSIGAVVLGVGTTLALGATTHCGNLESSYGPYDYRTHQADLAVVEKFHFTTEVEQLIRGKSGYLGQDIDYTLRTSPNHHRALLAMSRYGERLKVDKVPFATYSVECYFDRAIRFQSDDVIVRMLYARHLKVLGRQPEALRQLDFVADTLVDARGDVGFTHYNLGLSYLDLGAMDKALHHARMALDMGFPRTDLKEQLVKSGHWVDLPALPEAASAASAAGDGR